VRAPVSAMVTRMSRAIRSSNCPTPRRRAPPAHR
jgi:hypothetical protein